MASKRKRAARDAANSNQPSQKRPKGDIDIKKSTSELLRNKATFPDTVTGDDRRREAALYELLGSEEDSERIAAADTIVSGLLGGDGASEAVLQRHLDRRLFRGLASGRNASRLGFSLVLSEILGQLFGEKALSAARYTGLTFDKVLSILIEKTHAGGNIPGQEERDHYFGQLFGIECFVRAEILFEDLSRWRAVLDLLSKLASKKVWLRPQCGWVIVQAMPQMGREAVETTLQKLTQEGLAKTPEGVGIWVVALDRFRDLKPPSKPWRNPLDSKYLGEVAAVLREGGKDATNGEHLASRKQKQSNWTAQLHFVWDVILDHFTRPAGKSRDEVSEQFRLFWNRVVDDGFFSKNASDNQKFSGFMIFGKMIGGLSFQEALVEHLFSKNFMACLMNQAAKEDRYLHRAATKTLKAIITAAEARKALVVPILRQLLGDNGAYNFDQRTNTKTVQKLLQHTVPAQTTAVLDILKAPITKSLGDQDMAQLVRSYGDYLLKLATAPPTPETVAEHVSVAGLAVQELAKLAFSASFASAGPAMNKARELLRSRLVSAFARLVKRPDDFPYLCDAILSIDTSGTEMSEEIETELLEALEMLRELMAPGGHTAAERAPYEGLALLNAAGILQLYNEEPDAVEVLADLRQCHAKMKEASVDGYGNIFTEILVEILLSTVVRPSLLMRQVSQQVFESFAHLMSAEAIKLLTDTLSADENARGQQALFRTEEEDMADEAEGGESDGDVDGEFDGEVDSDVEFVDLQEVEAAEADEEQTGDRDDDEDEEQAQDLEDLDDALAEVLQSHRLDKDDEAESSSDDSDMSDSAMMELDSKLVEVFKQRVKGSNKRKENKSAKASVVNFKHRVLDLLDIYVKKEAANPVAFSALLPLLQLVRTTSTKSLGNKASEVILDLGRNLKKSRGNKGDALEIYEGELMELLRQIHDEASKDPSHAFAKAASAASLAVVSQLFAADKENILRISELYAKTQADWALGKIKIQPAFFSEWLNWCQGHASNASIA